MEKHRQLLLWGLILEQIWRKRDNYFSGILSWDRYMETQRQLLIWDLILEQIWGGRDNYFSGILSWDRYMETQRQLLLWYLILKQIWGEAETIQAQGISQGTDHRRLKQIPCTGQTLE